MGEDTSKYDYFTTSDGRVWAAEKKPVIPGWTPEQTRLAKRYILIGRIVVLIQAILLALFAAYKLSG